MKSNNSDNHHTVTQSKPHPMGCFDLRVQVKSQLLIFIRSQVLTIQII